MAMRMRRYLDATSYQRESVVGKSRSSNLAFLKQRRIDLDVG